MARDSLYGLEAQYEERKERFLRSPFARMHFFSSAYALLITLVLGELLLFWHPCLWLCVLPAFLVFLCARIWISHGFHLPMRMPKSYGGYDPNSPLPGKGYAKASGLFYLGNANNSQQLWIDKDDVLTHMLVLGTTGSGKTETLVSLACNYFALGSGIIYVDPKAAPKLGVQIWTMARMLGRDDDFLLINYMAEKRNSLDCACNPLRQSNTQNPFAVGDANSLTQLLFALMPEDPNGGSSIFSSTAQTLISGLLFVLVERRNMGLEALSIETIRSYLMDIAKIDALARETIYSETARLALFSALSTLGWDISKDAQAQNKNFYEQYSYARAYFGRALSLLVDNYGRIFRASCGEVDPVDVITNRRIFVTLIPSMDKDPKELKSLGQLCLASVRNACAVGLGTSVQGEICDVLGALPTEARVPFGIIVDEYAAIETPGFEILLTQGRGLGMAVTVASQDFAGIQRASAAAAEQIVSNCKVKLFMTTEDPNKTAALVQKLAGKGYVMFNTGYSKSKDAWDKSYIDEGKVRAQSLERVDFRDLQKQVAGDVTISFKGEVIRGRSFYANPPLRQKQQVRLQYFLQCNPPNSDEFNARFGAMQMLVEAFLLRCEAGIRDSGYLRDCFPEDENDVGDDAGNDSFDFASHALLSAIGSFMEEKRDSLTVYDMAIAALCLPAFFEGAEAKDICVQDTSGGAEKGDFEGNDEQKECDDCMPEGIEDARSLFEEGEYCIKDSGREKLAKSGKNEIQGRETEFVGNGIQESTPCEKEEIGTEGRCTNDLEKFLAQFMDER